MRRHFICVHKGVHGFTNLIESQPNLTRLGIARLIVLKKYKTELHRLGIGSRFSRSTQPQPDLT